MRMPKEIENMIYEYMNKYNKRPLPYNYDEWNSFDEYKKYLEKELEK